MSLILNETMLKRELTNLLKFLIHNCFCDFYYNNMKEKNIKHQSKNRHWCNQVQPGQNRFLRRRLTVMMVKQAFIFPPIIIRIIMY